jgi:hypothetical protein
VGCACCKGGSRSSQRGDQGRRRSWRRRRWLQWMGGLDLAWLCYGRWTRKHITGIVRAIGLGRSRGHGGLTEGQTLQRQISFVSHMNTRLEMRRQSNDGRKKTMKAMNKQRPVQS